MNALNAYNKLNANVAGLKKSSEKLSSGYRINRAGDDAAGLAVSEKMRSQIRGLNQAVRNSQDGINMIQTFEGAAQETHSILQRMKELAEESATGTYDNYTDRAAMQLEFDQLNDELNQIADTDFNGTIVLNGGEMSDGLKQVNGEFNYANKADQLMAKANELAQADLDAATAAYNKAEAKFAGTKFDLSQNGMAGEWNSVDNNLYDKNAADELWQKLGLTTDGSTTADADLTKGTSVDVTFEFDGEAWTVKSATSNKTGAIDSGLFANAFGTPTAIGDPAATSPTATGWGGFKFTAGGKDIHAVFDATNAKAGDTVTLTFTNSKPETHAPTHVAWEADSVNVNLTGKTNSDLKVTIAATDPLADDDIVNDKNLADVVNALDGQKLEVKYEGKAEAPSSVTLNGVTIDLTKSGTYKLLDEEGNNLKDSDGKDIEIQAEYKDGKLLIKTADGTKGIIDIEIPNAGTATDVGSMTGVIAIDNASYQGAAADPTVKAGDDPNLGTSNEAKKALDAAAEALAKATVAQQSIKDLESAQEYLSGKGVSASDAFNNSTARMTYTDNITLQVGARTKDAVNFTFNYNVDGSADMGSLKANLNLSSREDGLATAGLTIANQDDANYAIDQIDKAINKTSMVRASFGAIQNRLEHKITNLTTTSENLTEAESAIRDTDMASEMMNYTKFNILQQAAQSMLAQANQQPQSILQLLG